MAPELFDTHCHLNLADCFFDPDAEVERARAAGVTRLCLVGIDSDSNRRAVEIAARHEGVYAIVGWHPNSANAFGAGALSEIEALLNHPKAVAVGEIGLDYHWDFATPDQQRICLEAQLDLAERWNRPVVFHCREAYDDLLAILEGHPERPYLFHCFSGEQRHAERVLRLGGLIGVDGPLTYKKSEPLRELCRRWPRDRIVLETDSPYLSPEPHRGRPNHPAYLPLVNAALAACWGTDLEASARQTSENASRFFGLSNAPAGG